MPTDNPQPLCSCRRCSPEPSHLTAAGAESAKAGAELLANAEPEDTRRLTMKELADLLFGNPVSDPVWTGEEGDGDES